MKKLKVTVDGKVFDVIVEVLEEGTPDETLGITAQATDAQKQSQSQMGVLPPSGDAEPGIISSPMSGRVVSLDVKVGDEVKKGDRLVTVEAMKMHNYIDAPQSGRVSKIFVASGIPVEKGQALLKLS